ncbi:hypothetical protein GLOIN_2v1582864 [Rhizophagus clarus]|uniref:Uncharacterized protein n=1 Tax=Rhizophagus clarus TaxID=94130 RepID=A0A8H3L6N5_9GLOM|nr:hypothetical protein GLOIN_2v1582864 [Rhizophagus clarus]
MPSEIDLLRRENTRLMAENAEFKAKRDAENAELKARVAKLEEDSRQLESERRMETISPEKNEQVLVDKRMLHKENQKKQREKFIQEVSEDDSIPSVSS